MHPDYFKAMLVEHYGLDKKVDTSTWNYGLNLANMAAAEGELFDQILESSYTTKLDIFTLWEFVDSVQRNFVPQTLSARLVNDPSNSLVHLRDYYERADDRAPIDIAQLRTLAQAAKLCPHNLLAPSRGPEAEVYFWEYFYEVIRTELFPQAPKRSDSFFLFHDQEAAVEYNLRHEKGEICCRVIVDKVRTMFEGDMTILDETGMDLNFDQAAARIARYWRGELSDRPLIEILFQGTARCGAVVGDFRRS
ncbi:hypothetical protein [Massilia putida]|uniref:hypothetical protein n=1 Tax=Massilia putida TaxID=1141883 RepID=UPI000952144F|nr:hypothetical protein [Massilia putida]